ncbi:MAG: glycosyltransferase family 2 protein [Candidatus Firestonebacteria bacterium]|nr:glycosyltransferase family 2 protein [Candidatus Firestonebacteria bacterium]
MKVGIVIPMYNEAAGARTNLETILTYTRRLPGDVFVLVVNDASTDTTEPLVKKLIAEQPDDHLRLISHARNSGYGAANRTGAQYALEQGCDYALFMDSDLTNHPKYLADFYPPMQRGVDYIKASRYVPGGGMEGVPVFRQLISRAGNAAAARLFGLPLHDCTNGFRAVHARVLKSLRLKENKFALIVEELYQAKFSAASYAEVPTLLTARRAGEKPSSFTYPPSVFWTYFKYAFKAFWHVRPYPNFPPGEKP